jgi:uncharacterized damage-inducible protein DinB
MNNPFLKDIFAQLDIVSEQVKQNFIDLDESQLNWKPNEKSWSIGQCLDHLIVTNNQYSKIFKDFSSGQKKVDLLLFNQRKSPLRNSRDQRREKSLCLATGHFYF